MVTLIIKLCTTKYSYSTVLLQIFKRNFMKLHPYQQIHPWKSLDEFSDDLLKNIIFNKDGLVVLNKPYGIRAGNDLSSLEKPQDANIMIPYGVNYTIRDALPYIANQLNYSKLEISKAPEKYMSGVTILSATDKVKNTVIKAFRQFQLATKTFWVVAIGVPNILADSHRLAIRLQQHPKLKMRKAVITTSWSKNEEKRGDIKLLKTEYKVLSNSIFNLCSLISLNSSTMHRHAIRLYASTCLYCPVLGDNLCAGMIQKVGNSYLRVDPFLPCPTQKLDKKLLKLLDITPSKQEIIPAHIHLRSITLPMSKGIITFEAPIMPFFEWTCDQLELTLQKDILMSSNA